MVVPRDEAIPPISAVTSDYAGMQAFSSMPFNTSSSIGNQQPSEHKVGSEDSTQELPFKPETTMAMATMLGSNIRLCFERHEITGKMVARLKDAETGEVIRQIPPEEMLKLAEAIDRYLGLLVDRQS